MQISSRFTIAIHMLTCMENFKDEYKITSDFLLSLEYSSLKQFRQSLWLTDIFCQHAIFSI